MPRLQLTPHQNQEFRLLLRECRRILIAIPGYGNPLVASTLLLHDQAPSLLTALLAVAAQTRTFQATGSQTALWEPYQCALRDFQEDILSPNTSTIAAIAGAFVLVVLSSAGPSSDWQHHAAHVIRLVNCADIDLLKTTSTGSFLIMLAAHADIAAFALGRATPSTAAWTCWRLSEICNSLDDPFLPYEIVTGYPAALVSIISELDKCAASFATDSNVLGMPASDNVNYPEWARLRTALDSWKPCSPPWDMPENHSLALSTARRGMHRAAVLYHARVCGFHANLLNPLPFGIATLGMIEDVLISVRHLLRDYRLHAIPTANAMAWPLAVAGSECGNPCARHLQKDVLSLIEDMSRCLSMSHLIPLATVLQALWQRYESCEIQNSYEHLSMELVTRQNSLTILLW